MEFKIIRSDNIKLMLDAVAKAGKIILHHFSNMDQKLDIKQKDSGEYVTNLDLTVEISIIRILRVARPSYTFFTEEFYSAEGNLVSEYRWIIDPIDGTFNLIRENPNFGISIALEKTNLNNGNSEIVACVIFLPMLHQLYWAEKNCGAFCISAGIEKRIHFSNRTNWNDLLLASGESVTWYKELIMSLINNRNLQIRITGSAVIDFAFVASGKFDVLTQDSLKPWDIASGLLLCREAGGVVVNTSGNNANIYDSDIIVINPVLLDFLISKGLFIKVRR